MGYYVNIVEEVRNRLQNAALEKGRLEYVKNVSVGERKSVITPDQCPFIFIMLDSLSEKVTNASYGQRNADVILKLKCFYGLDNENADNLYFDTDTREGFLYFLEDVLDVLNLTTAGVADPRLSEKSKSIITARLNFAPEKLGDNVLSAEIIIETETADYFYYNRANI